ncbi:MAG TPA: DUF6689 family protein, partial [Thermoanaerobaculia bacterium]|nr:DUF6689 family protein [Thermoanaerobaculia bacterium]
LLPPPGDGIAELTISGNQATAVVAVADLEIDLTVTFEQVVGLSAANLGLSARLVDALDTTLLSRLPSGVSVPSGLPVLISIAPPDDGGLSFSGVVEVEVHTHALTFTAGTPLRFFASPAGGSFRDITDHMGMGSYRAGGRKGGFSDFLIVADVRPVTSVVDAKLAGLWSLLATHEPQIGGEALAELEGHLSAAETAWSGGDPLAAAAAADAFARAAKDHAGSGMPDVWRSARDLANVSGELRAAAATLRFSLNLVASS